MVICLLQVDANGGDIPGQGVQPKTEPQLPPPAAAPAAAAGTYGSANTHTMHTIAGKAQEQEPMVAAHDAEQQHDQQQQKEQQQLREQQQQQQQQQQKAERQHQKELQDEKDATYARAQMAMALANNVAAG
jgi:hypothetical protein